MATYFSATSNQPVNYNPIADTVLQDRVPPSLLGTVYGTVGWLSIVGEPLGLIVDGILVARFGVTTTVLCGGLAYTVILYLLLCSGSLRDLTPSTRRTMKGSLGRDDRSAIPAG